MVLGFQISKSRNDLTGCHGNLFELISFIHDVGFVAVFVEDSHPLTSESADVEEVSGLDDEHEGDAFVRDNGLKLNPGFGP